jgi:RHS repeat-associated protein
MAGRTTTATTGLINYTYSYDGDNKRLRATTTDPIGATQTNTAWDTTQAVPEIAVERDGTGVVTRRYTYGLDRISTTAGGAAAFYLRDALGSVANVTSPSGAKQWTYTYQPFGSAKTTTHEDLTAPDQPMRFAGEQLDATGLYHLRARQYDPATGRFTARDPLAPTLDDPHVSSYVYVSQRAGVLVDPTGEKGRAVGAQTPPTNRRESDSRKCRVSPPTIVGGRQESECDDIRAEIDDALRGGGNFKSGLIKRWAADRRSR